MSRPAYMGMFIDAKLGVVGVSQLIRFDIKRVSVSSNFNAKLND